MDQAVTDIKLSLTGIIESLSVQQWTQSDIVEEQEGDECGG